MRACSGEMYANLPRTAPPWVASDSARFAMPKSVSLTSPARDSSTFDGDTSRCTSDIGLPSGARASARARAPRRSRRRCGARDRTACAGARASSARWTGAEVLAVDELHDQEVLAVVTEADVEDLDDVAVLEQRQHLRLGDQQLDEPLVLRQVREDPLDRDGLLEAAGGHGLAAEDLRHAADADAVEQLVTSHAGSIYHGRQDRAYDGRGSQRLLDDALAVGSRLGRRGLGRRSRDARSSRMSPGTTRRLADRGRADRRAHAGSTSRR